MPIGLAGTGDAQSFVTTARVDEGARRQRPVGSAGNRLQQGQGSLAVSPGFDQGDGLLEPLSGTRRRGRGLCRGESVGDGEKSDGEAQGILLWLLGERLNERHLVHSHKLRGAFDDVLPLRRQTEPE